ncbi:hypothetical protein B0I35DRAFT_427610 [Stachybotrys elegans]|uniref:Uncharacterized protein n=1 Tax=Stachybotrys elegans TaxID=80388 RepID=A0A8K0STM5_9HYPO|nr:hypothetical protein B0I35DRAFT_427610 [Stachybotrys elegans]
MPMKHHGPSVVHPTFLDSTFQVACSFLTHTSQRISPGLQCMSRPIGWAFGAPISRWTFMMTRQIVHLQRYL